MNYSDKLIKAYRENFKPEMENAYIQFRARNDIAVWSNDPVYVDNMIFGKINGKTIDWSNNATLIRQKAEASGLVVYETNPTKHRFTVCIPRDAIVEAAMNAAAQETPNRYYIANSVIIKYNDVEYDTNTIDNEELKSYFKHKEEM